MNASWKRYSKFIAERAIETMREKNITQVALASRIGRTQQYVSHVLSGKENLTIETIVLFSEALESNLMKDILTGASGASSQSGLLMDSQPEAPYGSLKSSLPVLVSSSPIIRRFSSGERPFLIACEDTKKYLCKAAEFSGGAVNLARELIGSSFANIWGLSDMSLAIVKVLPGHLDGDELHYNYAVSCLGREWLEDCVEIRDNHLSQIDFTEETFSRLMKIALFDIWLSNEDRLNNNLNLLYSNGGRIVAIDHTGIFSGSFAAPLLPLSLTDSVIYSNLFSSAARGLVVNLSEIEDCFYANLKSCRESVPQIWTRIPNDWKIDRSKFDRLMEYVFSPKWTESCVDALKCFLR